MKACFVHYAGDLASVDCDFSWFGCVEGLEIINRITSVGCYQLRVDMEDESGMRLYETYDDFKIGDKSTLFEVLSLGTSEGKAG
jgi:hypothetical protein